MHFSEIEYNGGIPYISHLSADVGKTIGSHVCVGVQNDVN